MFVEYGEWLPDIPAFMNPGSTVAKNVIPGGASYLSFASPDVYSNALTARCQGAVSTKDADGNTVNFAGDATKLYRMASSTYSDVSKVGGYTTSTEEMWNFARFSNLLLATNLTDSIQTFTVNSGSNFSNLSAGAPKARYIANIGNFVVVGNTFDAIDGNVPHRIRWSALGDPTDWTVSATTQADYNDLDPSKGWIRGVIGGEYGTIFQERAISRMEYTGSPTIWRFNEVESGKGTQSAGSIIKVGNSIAYLGLDGFYMFDGNSSIPIGVNKIDRTFWADVDLNYLARIVASADFDKQIIYWAYPGQGNTAGLCNRILCYNYSPNAKKRWTIIEDANLEMLYISLSEGYNLDTLDSLGYNLDTLPYSLDSRVFTGENFILSGFNSNHKQVNFTGSAMDAVLETMELQLFPNNRAEITLIRPIIDGSGTITTQMGTRNSHSESVTYSSPSSTNSIGECDFRADTNARYHRVRANIVGGFNDVQGIDILQAVKVGAR